ncbi:hypothetical protein FHR66_001880 [Xanthomonas sp. F4]
MQAVDCRPMSIVRSTRRTHFPSPTGSLLPFSHWEKVPRRGVRVRVPSRTATPTAGWHHECASRRTLTPTPLPGGEGLKACTALLQPPRPASLFPPGEGAPQGRMRVRVPPRTATPTAGWHHECASRRTLAPTPLPGGEGLKACTALLQPPRPRSLLPPGEGAPQGRMRVRVPPRTPTPTAGWHHECASRRTFTPTPLPGERGLKRARHCFSHRDLASLLPPGEGAPQGRMRVRVPPRTATPSCS